MCKKVGGTSVAPFAPWAPDDHPKMLLALLLEDVSTKGEHLCFYGWHGTHIPACCSRLHNHTGVLVYRLLMWILTTHICFKMQMGSF
eukprot:1136468-Pelagomonas_calceolata.AAC.1